MLTIFVLAALIIVVGLYYIYSQPDSYYDDPRSYSSWYDDDEDD